MASLDNRIKTMEQAKNALKELILDDDFTNLQNLVSEEINLMDILNVSHRELAHSNFLAWLFDPNASHNLGDYAIKQFIKLYYRENEFQDLGLKTPLSVFDFVQLDFDDLEIRREYKNIDLILLSEKNRFCIVVENKIYAQEKRGQLEKYRRTIEAEYPDFSHKIYIFLSLNQQSFTEDERDYYLPLGYDHIVKLIEQILLSRGANLADNGRFVFEQYLQTLKSMLGENEEIKKIAGQLYKKYQPAFDLVFKYIAKSKEGMPGNNPLVDLINSEPSIRPFKSNNTFVRFQPNFLYEVLPQLRAVGFALEDDDLSDNFIFLFEFNVRENFINFDFKIGEGDHDIRRRLYSFYLKHSDFFNQVAIRETLSPKWHLTYRKPIVTKSEYDKHLQDEEFDVSKLITKRFEDLIRIEIPQFEEIIRKEIGAPKLAV